MIATVAEPQFLESGPVARELGVAVETLRFWERTGKIASARRTAGGRRLYTREEVEAIRATRERDQDARQIVARA
jgi:DNA-binding transcriptional MerR regulator